MEGAENLSGFVSGVGLHEGGAEVGGAWEGVDVDFEIMLQGLVGTSLRISFFASYPLESIIRKL